MTRRYSATIIRFQANCMIAGLFLLVGTAGKVAAQEYCSAGTTAGKYVVVCNGYLTPAPNAPLTPAKLLATSRSDFQGHIQGTGTASIGGMVVTQQVTGTEKVNSDCTGTITYTQTINGQPGPPLSFTFVISHDGDRLDGLSTDPGSVLSCVLQRTSHDFNASVRSDSHEVKPASIRKPRNASVASERSLTSNLRTPPSTGRQ